MEQLKPFDQWERIEEGRGAPGCHWFVVRGHAPEGPGERRFLKLYQPDAAVCGPGAASRGVGRFLERAEAQRRAAAGGWHWAAVHELGEVPGGAYCITDHYTHSLDRLLRGRVKLDARRFRAIVRGVTKGLLELKRTCGRPHGNLKPSNVLLSLTEGSAAVALCDPCDADIVSSEGYEANDVFAVGLMMRSLVLHLPLEDRGWPLPPASAWRALGRRGEAWRDLCNRLLHPNPQDGLSRLEDLASTVVPLCRGGSPRWRGAAVVAMVSALGVGGIWYGRPRSAAPTLPAAPVAVDPIAPPAAGPAAAPATPHPLTTRIPDPPPVPESPSPPAVAAPAPPSAARVVPREEHDRTKRELAGSIAAPSPARPADPPAAPPRVVRAGVPFTAWVYVRVRNSTPVEYALDVSIRREGGEPVAFGLSGGGVPAGGAGGGPSPRRLVKLVPGLNRIPIDVPGIAATGAYEFSVRCDAPGEETPATILHVRVTDEEAPPEDRGPSQEPRRSEVVRT